MNIDQGFKNVVKAIIFIGPQNFLIKKFQPYFYIKKPRPKTNSPTSHFKITEYEVLSNGREQQFNPLILTGGKAIFIGSGHGSRLYKSSQTRIQAQIS